MLEAEWIGNKSLEGLFTKLVLHHGSGTSAVAGNSNVAPPGNSCRYPMTIGVESNTVWQTQTKFTA